VVHKSPRKSRHRNHAGGRNVASRSVKPQVERANNQSEAVGVGSSRQAESRRRNDYAQATAPKPPMPSRASTPPHPPGPDSRNALCHDPGHRGLDLVVRLVTGGVAFGAGYLMNLLPIPFATTLAVALMAVGATAVGYLFSRKHILPRYSRRSDR
jgi:hypothetical protein